MSEQAEQHDLPVAELSDEGEELSVEALDRVVGGTIIYNVASPH